MAKLQEQLSTGRVINRPSDSPTGTTSAMRLRDDLRASQQYQRNAQDGVAWLGTIDTTLTSITDQTRRHATRRSRVPTRARSARRPATRSPRTVDQLRKSLLSDANTTYLGRPVFGGITAGDEAYDATGAFVGTDRRRSPARWATA